MRQRNGECGRALRSSGIKNLLGCTKRNFRVTLKLDSGSAYDEMMVYLERVETTANWFDFYGQKTKVIPRWKNGRCVSMVG